MADITNISYVENFTNLDEVTSSTSGWLIGYSVDSSNVSNGFRVSLSTLCDYLTKNLTQISGDRIKDNSIPVGKLKASSVKESDLSDESVTTSKLKEGSVITSKISESTLDQTQPVGSIIMWVGTEGTLPPNWKLCDGSSLNEEDYPLLKKVILPSNGKIFLPDFRGLFPLGAGATTASTKIAATLASTGGNSQFSLSESQIPSHTHKYKNYFHCESYARDPKANSKYKWDGTDVYSSKIIGSNDTDMDNKYLYYLNSTTYTEDKAVSPVQLKPPY